MNVVLGLYQWRARREHGWRLWTPEVRDPVFADGPSDYPPLGRLWLGMWHDFARWLWPPRETGALDVTACARVGSAIAFGITVWLIGAFAGRWFGPTAGWAAALCYVLMPRVSGHAHLANIETCMNLAFLAPILYVGQKWGATNPADGQPLAPRRQWLVAVVVGVLIGAAFLTKIQAVLLPIPIAAWTLIRWRGRGLAWLSVAGAVTVLVFFAGWPWLQIDPVAHLGEYLGRTVDRATLNCWYFGRKYADIDVPWHYPLVLFVGPVPAVMHIRAASGRSRRLQRHRRAQVLAAGEKSPAGPLPGPEDKRVDAAQSQSAIARTWLLGVSFVFVLTFFALPGIPVYDGVRLFLVAFPLWAMAAGAGAQHVKDWLAFRKSERTANTVLVIVLALQSYGILRFHPCELSYYSLPPSGLAGAELMGLERTYWQDSVTRSFLGEVVANVPEGATLYLAPQLHPSQAMYLLLQSPVLVDHGVQVRAYDDRFRDEIRYVVVFRRRADQWASLEPSPPGGTLLAEVQRVRVQLAALYELPPVETGEVETGESGRSGVRNAGENANSP